MHKRLWKRLRPACLVMLAGMCLLSACDRGANVKTPDGTAEGSNGQTKSNTPPDNEAKGAPKEGNDVKITKQTLELALGEVEDTLKFAPAGDKIGDYPAAEKTALQQKAEAVKKDMGTAAGEDLAGLYSGLQQQLAQFRHSRKTAESLVEVDAAKLLRDKPINRHSMGFNAMPFYLTDDVRAAMIPYLQQLRTGILRFPGGELTSFFHWDYPDISSKESKLDVWDPKVDAEKYKNKQTKNMDIDEFMEFCRLIGAEPMAGVNIESGVKWNRVQDSLDEAVRNLKYTMDKQYPIKYWYMDNETYLDNPSNHVHMTVEDYAKYVNLFSSALKKVNPEVRTVVNWHPNNHAEWKTLFKLAGDQIDVAEKHQYWSHNSGTYAKWLYQNPLTVYTDDPKKRNKPYEQQLDVFRQVIDDSFPSGKPMEIGILEWNIGGKQARPMSSFEIGLVQTQILTQIIKGGVDMGTMWPLNWPGLDEKTLYNSKTKKTNPDFEMFKLISNVMGQNVLDAKSSLPNVYTLGTASASKESVTVFLINKTEDGISTPTRIHMTGFQPSEVNAVSVTAKHLSDDDAVVEKIKVTPSGTPSEWTVELPPHSFTAITFGVNKDGLRADIANARQMDVYGSQVKAADTLKNAAAEAEGIVGSTASTQAQVDAAVAKLQDAMAKFAKEAYGKGWK